MSNWEIIISKSARKYLEKLEVKKKETLLNHIRELKNWVENDTQIILDIKSLKGDWEGKLRLRVGNLRIIFELIPAENQIKIIYIGPRGDVY